MDKNKIIKVLKSLPQVFYETVYCINIWGNEEQVKFQMKYNSELASYLSDGNKWECNGIDANGYMVFTNGDGIKVIMT